MVGLEPSHIAGLILFGDDAEPDEGAHLVRVALNRMGQSTRTLDGRIGQVVKHVPFALMDAPDQAVEQRETLLIARLDDRLGKREKTTRHGKGGRTITGIKRCLELRAVGKKVIGGADGPDDVIRIDPAQDEATGSRTPAREIHLMGQYRRNTHSSASCAGLARRADSRALSSDPRG